MSPAFDIGFLGGGQLARMSIQAAQRMGLKCLSLDPGADTPASQIAPSVCGAFSDPERIAVVLRQCERITLENEFIPADAIEAACGLAGVPTTRLIPGVSALRTIQDKLRQREALTRAGVPSPRAVPLRAPIEDVVRSIGFPMMVKTRFGGYDGKGAFIARDLDALWALRNVWDGDTCLAEEFVEFRRELAVMVYIGAEGAGCFPTMETVQVDHVCDLVYPCAADGTQIALAAVEAVGGEGLYGVELFELADGSLQVNEIAPRPHNTGHYTLDWGGVSQFEQHVRLVMGWPLVEPLGLPTCMANLLGQPNAGRHADAISAALEVPGTYLHWYGKAVAKPGRKMGHLNAVGDGCVERAVASRDRFYDAWTR